MLGEHMLHIRVATHSFRPSVSNSDMLYYLIPALSGRVLNQATQETSDQECYLQWCSLMPDCSMRSPRSGGAQSGVSG